METNGIRWKQSFANFEKAFMHLEEALQIKSPDIIQKAGIIQFFEMSYELAWNTIKDFLEEQGFTEVTYPRSAIKKAFETGLIEDGHSWMEMILDRNLTAHAFDEEKVNQIEKLIHGKYYPLLKAVYIFFKQKQHE